MTDDKKNQAEQMQQGYERQQRDYEGGGANPAGGAGSTSTPGNPGVNDEVREERDESAGAADQ